MSFRDKGASRDALLGSAGHSQGWLGQGSKEINTKKAKVKDRCAQLDPPRLRTELKEAT